MNKPLLVLDTNVVLDLLHFDDAAARPLRVALEAGAARCVTTELTLGEWQRVLGYPEFALDPARQSALVTRYRQLTESRPTVRTSSRVPRCSDADDQKFIDLAVTAQAQALVSKDRALLRLRRRCAPLFRMMTPAEAVAWLGGLQR